MKRANKILAALMAAATLTAGTSALVSNAENTAIVADTAVQTAVAELNTLVADGTVTAKEAAELKKLLLATEEDDTTPGDYPSYTEYAEMASPASTSHGVGFIYAGTGNLGSTYFDFYLNRNMDANDPTNSNNYYTIYNNVTITPHGELTSMGTTSARKYRVYIGTSSFSATYFEPKAVFYYMLSSNVYPAASEKDIDRLTNDSYDTDSEPVREYSTSNSKKLFKCTFARGDVNRDSNIDNNDSILIMKYLTGLMNSPTDPIDKEVFKLAADCTGDGEVDIRDVVLINNYINGTASVF